MKDKLCFFDSNILVYLVDDDDVKREKADTLLNPKHIISSQVVAENINVCLKKLNFTKDKAYKHGLGLIAKLTYVAINPSTFNLAFMIHKKYQLSNWDSLIIASALENNCETLYSEDMQDGLVIENTLTIVNPFLK
jgi:predicted nucleic acid-binding protein